LALEVLHDKKMGGRGGWFRTRDLTHVIERADMRMVELRNRLGFALKPAAEFGVVGPPRAGP
jgi:hypothetical protein